MRKVAFLAVAWLAVFGAVFGIGWVRSHGEDGVRSENPSSPSTITDALAASINVITRIRLNQVPLSIPMPTDTVDEVNTHPVFFESLNKELLRDKDTLLRCVTSSRSSSRLPNDYLDVSFEIVEDQTAALILGVDAMQNTFRLAGTRLERSTFSLSPEEEECLINVISRVVLRSDTAPSQRIMYPLCIANWNSQQKG